MVDILFTRTTPLELSGPAPDAGQLDLALAAAQAAPDHGRLRPWTFLVIRDSARTALGQVMAAALRRREPTATSEQMEHEAAKPLRAPLIVVVACSFRESAKVPAGEQLMAASAAAQNFQLAIHALGFGCQWKTGPAARDEGVCAALGLATGDQIVGFMYVGSIAQSRPAHDRVPDAGCIRHWTGVR